MTIKTASAAKRTAKKEASVPVKFFINKPHKPADMDHDVRSHMVGIRKDVKYPIYVMESLHDEFSKPVYGNGRRGGWRAITDARYLDRYPEYDIFWCCRADKKPDEYVLGMFMAIFNAPHEERIEEDIDGIDFPGIG